jgi:hypothetical protein
MKISFKKVEVTKLNLKPGDILMITIKHDDIDRSMAEEFRNELKQAFPSNQVFLTVLDTEGDITYSIVSESK